MICPQCGYDMGNKNKCMRCGYEVKTLAVVDEHANDERVEQEKDETKIIDPCNVYLTHPYGYEDDEGTGYGPFGSPFSSLFDDLFGDPISDLLGGLFGFDVGTRRTRGYESKEPEKKKKKQGPIVEVNEVEVIEDDGADKTDDKPKADDDTHKQSKNPFKRNGKRK